MPTCIYSISAAHHQIQTLNLNERTSYTNSFCFIMTYISRASRSYYAQAYRFWIKISAHRSCENVSNDASSHVACPSAFMIRFLCRHVSISNSETQQWKVRNWLAFDIRHTGKGLVNTCICVTRRKRAKKVDKASFLSWKEVAINSPFIF